MKDYKLFIESLGGLDIDTTNKFADKGLQYPEVGETSIHILSFD
jgi:hypothetical protein